jgi:hypothetical protein
MERLGRYARRVGLPEPCRFSSCLGPALLQAAEEEDASLIVLTREG